MKVAGLALALAGLAGASRAQAQAPRPMDYLARVVPDVEIIAKLDPPKAAPGAPAPVSWYPAKAQRERIEGHATIRCDALMESGVLRQCRLLEETPAGWGFGAAALRAARLVPHIAKVHGPFEMGGVYVLPFLFRMDSSPAQPAPRAVTAPVLTFNPGRDELARIIDGDAANVLPNSWAFVQCVLGGIGPLHDCRVLTQSAPMPAIGRVAVQLVQTFRLKPWDRRYGWAPGRPIRMWVGFGRDPAKAKR